MQPSAQRCTTQDRDHPDAGSTSAVARISSIGVQPARRRPRRFGPCAAGSATRSSAGCATMSSSGRPREAALASAA
jgi:hypothetical protein